MRFGKMFPDELEHEELVEIGVEQGTRDGIHLPVVVVRAPGEIDNHDSPTLLEMHGLEAKKQYCKVRRGAPRSASENFEVLNARPY